MYLRKILRHIIPMVILVMTTSQLLYSQDEENYYDDILQRVDTIDNPVYKPMISFGYGILSFVGDVQNSFMNPIVGNPAGRLNISTFIDNKHYISANFFFMAGVLSGDQHSLSDASKNLNFRSNIYSVGVSASYAFGHFIPEEMFLRPYVSIGFEQVNFSSKGDLFNGNEQRYYYWADGTIRTIAEGQIGAAYPLERDYIYETDLRSFEREEYDLGAYNSGSIAIPFEIGFRLRVSQRVNLSIGTEYHFTFTDFIDNVSSKGTSIVGNKMKDGYMFTHASMQFDMFSDPKTRTVDLLYADYDLDPIFFDDEDGDFILDLADRCPGTPYGVVTDTLGCALDGDGDGVPDYLDKELKTDSGVWVDDEGVTLLEADFLGLLQREEALNREDLDVYLEVIEATFKDRSVTEIPERFAVLDANEDGYISFDELLKVIDQYFDFNVDLSLEELRQVNEFFFSQ